MSLIEAKAVWNFFFQAEDGIRDHCVTGVQTCALPIYCRQTEPDLGDGDNQCFEEPAEARLTPRSEERRVGKECRYRWWTNNEKKNAETSTRAVSSNPNFVTRQKIEIIFG